MKKLNYFLWYFPISFFLFIGLFIFVKFIFIFFFKAAFEPGFIFDLTPFYVLSGVNNLHLIFLSLIVIFFDIYFHINVSRKNLLISFIPTGIILSGLGLRIITSVMALDNIFHFIIFGIIILIALIDNKHSLIVSDIVISSKQEFFIPKTPIQRPYISKYESKYESIPQTKKSVRSEEIDEILTLHKETLIDLRNMLKDDLKRAQNMMEELEKKSRKIDYLSVELEEKRKNLTEEENLFRRRYISSINNNIPASNIENKIQNKKNIIIEKKSEEDSFQPTMLDDINECAAIIKRGILKQVNDSFVKLLGFDSDTLIEKNLFNFIAPEGFHGIQDYFINKLKGKIVSNYETILLTNDNRKIPVKITIKPINYKGIYADIVYIKNLNDKQQ